MLSNTDAANSKPLPRKPLLKRQSWANEGRKEKTLQLEGKKILPFTGSLSCCGLWPAAKNQYPANIQGFYFWRLKNLTMNILSVLKVLKEVKDASHTLRKRKCKRLLCLWGNQRKLLLLVLLRFLYNRLALNMCYLLDIDKALCSHLLL